MREDIISYLSQEVYNRCRAPENMFGIGCFYHIRAVVKNGRLLAHKYDADEEIVILSAWLHDIASVTDYSLYQEHHIHGAEIAKDILGRFSYDKEKIERVCGCIRNHRGSIESQRLTVEEMCVADADAISHFDNVPGLLYLAYGQRRMDMESGRAFVKNKLERSFRKLSRESREYYSQKYEQVMDILNEKQ